MIKTLDIFKEIPCLTEHSSHQSGLVIQKKWLKSADKRVMGQYLQKFIQYNSKQFAFLGVEPFITGTDQNTDLYFRSSNFIGTIPLRGSDTGKQIGDFVVTPRYTGNNRFEDYIEILNLLGKEISPLVIDSLPLVSGNNFRPPLYLEAVKYISSIEQLLLKHWRKFDSFEKISNQPSGQVCWDKYIKVEYKVENRLKFPTRKNVLSEFHSEFSELRYVFDICKKELLSFNTPQRIKNSIRSKIIFIEEKLYLHEPKISNKIFIKSSDSPTIKKCKIQANKILNFNLTVSTAWRVDFSDVFEKYIQYIFNEVALETGGFLFKNFKFHSKNTKNYCWQLKHIEPDIIYQKNELMVLIDAKYKSNLYNKYNKSEVIKNDHRHDLHQILAYSSFSKNNHKYSFLCYPANNVEVEEITYNNRINGVINTIYILGVPLKISAISDVKTLLCKKISGLGF